MTQNFGLRTGSKRSLYPRLGWIFFGPRYGSGPIYMKVMAELIPNIPKLWNLTCEKWFLSFRKSQDFENFLTKFSGTIISFLILNSNNCAENFLDYFFFVLLKTMKEYEIFISYKPMHWNSSKKWSTMTSYSWWAEVSV